MLCTEKDLEKSMDKIETINFHQVCILMMYINVVDFWVVHKQLLIYSLWSFVYNQMFPRIICVTNIHLSVIIYV